VSLQLMTKRKNELMNFIESVLLSQKYQ